MSNSDLGFAETSIELSDEVLAKRGSGGGY